jgi:transcriptional regulator with XRE-family HTH domain
MIELAFSRSTWYRVSMGHKKLSDEIRDAVNASGLSRYSIAKNLGIAESTMSRFMSGKGGLSMDYIDRLAQLLRLHIVVTPAKEQARRK